MKTIEVSTTSKPLSEYIKELNDEIVVLTFHRKPVAAIISLEKVDRESLSLSTNPEFLAIIEKAREEFRMGNKLSLDEMKQEILE